MPDGLTSLAQCPTAAARGLMRQLLAWIAQRPRTYGETMDAWRSHCPRLSVWEDATSEGLVRVANGRVELTARGRGILDRD